MLDIAADEEPHQFQPVPGAAELLAHISATTNYRAIIATGAWRDSADIKISCAGLDAGSLPVVTADAAPTRERLLAGAISLATDRYDVSGFDRIVSVGDAIWDVQAPVSLQAPFVGLAGGPAAAILREAGVSYVFEGLEDPKSFLAACDRARPPRKG